MGSNNNTGHYLKFIVNMNYLNCKFVIYRLFSDDEGLANEMDNLPADVTIGDREAYKRVREKALEVVRIMFTFIC